MDADEYKFDAELVPLPASDLASNIEHDAVVMDIVVNLLQGKTLTAAVLKEHKEMNALNLRRGLLRASGGLLPLWVVADSNGMNDAQEMLVKTALWVQSALLPRHAAKIKAAGKLGIGSSLLKEQQQRSADTFAALVDRASSTVEARLTARAKEIKQKSGKGAPDDLVWFVTYLFNVATSSSGWILALSSSGYISKAFRVPTDVDKTWSQRLGAIASYFGMHATEAVVSAGSFAPLTSSGFYAGVANGMAAAGIWTLGIGVALHTLGTLARKAHTWKKVRDLYKVKNIEATIREVLLTNFLQVPVEKLEAWEKNRLYHREARSFPGVNAVSKEARLQALLLADPTSLAIHAVDWSGRLRSGSGMEQAWRIYEPNEMQQAAFN